MPICAVVLFALGLLPRTHQAATDPCLVPLPLEMTRDPGEFRLTPETRIVTDASTRRLGRTLAAYVEQATGWHLRASAGGGPNRITLKILPDWKQPEGYRMQVGRDGVEIAGTDAAGVFYGIQTLRQLLPAETHSSTPVTSLDVPCVRIEDHPRFPWRGMMLDCSRHFFPKAFIEKFVDLLAEQKMNTFHWHLTDDQGWRLEIKRYPKLTEIGSQRKETLVGSPHQDPRDDRYDNTSYGGYYTQDDVREVVRYAAERFVRVVPEIELPGHSAAALASYPELATHPPVEVWTSWGVNPNTINLEESTFNFYENVLDEVFRLFPDPYIHLGGDEAPTDQWAASPRIQQRMRELGIPSIDRIQPYITARMARFVASHGRRMVGWDEVLNGELPSNVVVMSWRGTSGGEKAAAAGHDVVMAPNGYIYFGPRLQIERVYSYDPAPPSLPAGRVLGAQGEIWCEHELTPENVEYAAFPNASALAEVDWTPQASRSYADFLRRLSVHMGRLRAEGVHVHELP
jgi:hexosaminidase